jgi:hypothetical protein
MKYDFIGWNNEVEDETQHDKIWGVVRQQGQAISFWGRRVGPWTFKQIDDRTVEKQIRAKERKGYKQVDSDYLISLDEGFQDRFDDGVILAVCGNFFHKAPS